MVDVHDWVFKQLGGQRLSFRLSGYAAPFGRPRKGAVFTETDTVREAETYCPGVDVPTRHIFGMRHEPIVLKGRWMDSALGGPGSARAQRDIVRKVVNAKIPVSIDWGPVLSARGLLKELQSAWESQHECAWQLEILIDSTNLDEPAKTYTVKPVPYYTDKLKAIALQVEEEAEYDALKVPIQDALGLIVGTILQPIADLENLANDMKSMKEGTIGQIRRLRAGLSMARRAFRTFRDLHERYPTGDAIEAASARNDVGFKLSQARASLLILEAFALIAEADREARRAQVQKIKSVITAQPGDTWESISVAIYGDASRAQDLRDTNDTGTEQPVPGETYIAPT